MPMPMPMPQEEARNDFGNDDQLRKRERQQEYNRQLQMDQQRRVQQPDLGPREMDDIGMRNNSYEDEQRQKREAQRMYNKALHEQQEIDKQMRSNDKTGPQQGLGIGDQDGDALQRKKDQQRKVTDKE